MARQSSNHRGSSSSSSMSSMRLLLAIGTLAALLAGAAAQTVTVENWQFQPTGSYSYKWTLEKTANGAPAGTTSVIRVQKGVKTEIPYTLKYTRSVDQTTANMQVAGSFSVAVTAATPAPDPAPPAPAAPTASVTLNPPTGAATTVPATCTGTAPNFQCTFSAATYNGFLSPGTATASVTYNGQTVTSSPSQPFVFDNVVGKYATALLTDKVDLSPLDTLYSGFTGFSRSSVWNFVDPGASIPDAGLTVQDSDTKTYTVRAGSFVVCTGTSGTTITNTATLTPQSAGANGTPIPVTASITLQIWGCDLPPDVNFQDLQTWGAQSFSWQLTKAATRNVFNVEQNAGSLAVEYTLRATAQPTTGTFAVSGAVFVNNVQPGILNIARLQVQLSTGQTAIPTCSLTTAYTSSDGMVWGGANAGGSITTTPFASTGLPIVTTGTAAALAVGATGIGTGVFNQFVLPEFASATCRFNISLGSTNPGSMITIVPQMNWGFGGMYMLNQPSLMNLNFNPPDMFFPVGGCVSITDVAQSGALQIANGGPNNQQVCVEGRAAPFTQPPPITYAVTATINPTTTSDCTPGGSKSYTITNTATATPIGGGSPVTASATPPVQVTVNCARAETVAVIPQAAADTNKLNVAVGQFSTFTAGEHAWTVEKTVDDDTVSLRVGELPKTLTYKIKVTKLPVSASKNFVSGKITVTNTGVAPVDLSAVSVTAGEAAVPASCPPEATQAQPSVPVVCSFNVSWNNGANSGSLGARVDTPTGSFYGAPAAFDFTSARQGSARGRTADVYDEVVAKAPAGALGAPTKWWVSDGSEPPSKAEGYGLTTADSREYTYTVQVGPFADKGSCGTYTLTNTATLVPSDAPGSTVTDATTVSVSVTGCGNDESLLSTADARGEAVATIGDLKTAKLVGSEWAVNASAAPPEVDLGPAGGGKAGEAEFKVTFEKVPTALWQVSGTVTVANTNPDKATKVSVLTVALDSTGGVGRTVDATCGGSPLPLTIAAGGTAKCSFSANLTSAAPGEAIAIATDGEGRAAESSPAPFNFEGAAEVVEADGGAPSCAIAYSGLVVGIPTWQPDGAVSTKQTEQRVCETTTVTVPVTVGPLKDNGCGAMVATSIAAVRPLGAHNSGPLLAATPLPVNSACPKGAPAQPTAVASQPKVVRGESYTWTASFVADGPRPLVVKRGEVAKVTFVAETQRSPVARSVALAGTVTLEAPAPGVPVTVAKASVAVYDGRETYTTAPLTCGPGATPGGPVTLPGKGSPVVCAYNASGLAVAPGAVLPVVVVEGGAGPVPAAPVPYSLKGSTRDISGDCADIGASMQLSAKGGKRSDWQPAFAGQALRSGSDCDGGDTQRFTLVFGGDAQGKALKKPPPCGDYAFAATFSVVPANGEAIEKDVEFPVRVTGCRRRALA